MSPEYAKYPFHYLICKSGVDCVGFEWLVGNPCSCPLSMGFEFTRKVKWRMTDMFIPLEESIAPLGRISSAPPPPPPKKIQDWSDYMVENPTWLKIHRCNFPWLYCMFGLGPIAECVNCLRWRILHLRWYWIKWNLYLFSWPFHTCKASWCFSYQVTNVKSPSDATAEVLPKLSIGLDRHSRGSTHTCKASPLQVFSHP